MDSWPGEESSADRSRDTVERAAGRGGWKCGYAAGSIWPDTFDDHFQRTAGAGGRLYSHLRRSLRAAFYRAFLPTQLPADRLKSGARDWPALGALGARAAASLPVLWRLLRDRARADGRAI